MMQDTSALEYSLAATVCLEPKRVLQLRQIVSVEDFSVPACYIGTQRKSGCAMACLQPLMKIIQPPRLPKSVRRTYLTAQAGD